MGKGRELLWLLIIVVVAVGGYWCAMGGLQKIITGGL